MCDLYPGVFCSSVVIRTALALDKICCQTFGFLYLFADAKILVTFKLLSIIAHATTRAMRQKPTRWRICRIRMRINVFPPNEQIEVRNEVPNISRKRIHGCLDALRKAFKIDVRPNAVAVVDGCSRNGRVARMKGISATTKIATRRFTLERRATLQKATQRMSVINEKDDCPRSCSPKRCKARKMARISTTAMCG